MVNQRIAIIRVRGSVGINRKIADTLHMLRLYKKNTSTIVNNSPSCIGMLKKIKDYVTWGELDEETFKLLLEKRGKLPGNQKLTEQYLQEKTKLGFDQFTKAFMEFKKDIKDIPGLKSFFRLRPPEHGFERKGIKKPFSLGGALGYRKEKINELIQKMV